MYKVLIVDDDGLIREDVQTMMDWREHGYDIIGEAENGKAALKLIEQHDPDIILTDIYMPVMDGIELIKQVRSARRKAKIVVMSNYDDFASVKEAMKYGASDYVLKYKLDPDVLLDLLGQTKKLLAAEARESEQQAQLEKIRQVGQTALTNQFWSDWLSGGMTAEDYAERAARLGIPHAKGVWVPVLVQADKLEREDVLAIAGQQEEYADAVKVGENEVILLIFTVQRSYLLLKQLQHEISLRLVSGLMDRHGMVVKGDICMQPSDLRKQLQIMKEKLSDVFYEGYKALMDTSTPAAPRAGTVDTFAFDSYELAIVKAVQAADGEYATEQLQLLNRYLAGARFEPLMVREALRRLGEQLIRAMKNKGFTPVEEVNPAALKEALLAEHATLSSLMKLLISLVAQFVEHQQSGNRLADLRLEIRNAISYMEQGYADDISLTDVSNHVGLSKNHFCKLFKQETGDNFINVLNKIRIEKAKLFIMQPDSRVKDIAGKVGMDNYRYFCRIFKQMTGLRPTEYKQSANQVR
ncbi:response regulator [Paenibacillus sp. JDR-2]|uniref:response regulator n=1 Tax=Paenibacillus sp. (strain JDR-2) TaxID=324057 RepID=UPI0001666C9B|nr:response regulator [Paenibacillus sp. JDR-2]ACT01228.1 two component transcriptional regulator, AraC family [Paenibacillus sp. JDR-2]